jgi:ABC-type dipeptide/oligopeptide/nickel transport system permease component
MLIIVFSVTLNWLPAMGCKTSVVVPVDTAASHAPPQIVLALPMG